MGFSSRQKKFFYEELGLNNRKISQKMDGYSEQLVGRYINSDDISAAWIEKIIKYFGAEVDFNYLLKEEDLNDRVEEERTIYRKKSIELSAKIRENLTELETTLSRI